MDEWKRLLVRLLVGMEVTLFASLAYLFLFKPLAFFKFQTRIGEPGASRLH